MVFPARDEATELKEPGEEPLDLPPPSVSAKCATVSCPCADTVLLVRSDELDAALLEEGIKRVAVIRLISNHPPGEPVGEPPCQNLRNERHLCGGCAREGEAAWMARTACESHDFTSFPPLRGTDQAPPFFAGTKVASTKVSERSRSRESSWRTRDHAPCRVHSRNQRWRVDGEG